MSMETCRGCALWIDTDDDPQTYREAANIWLCDKCWDEQVAEGKWRPASEIWITKAEQQSGLDRVCRAEGLIEQLPNDHDGRNSWLLNYGQKDEARALRRSRRIGWDENFQAANTVKP